MESFSFHVRALCEIRVGHLYGTTSFACVSSLEHKFFKHCEIFRFAFAFLFASFSSSLKSEVSVVLNRDEDMSENGNSGEMPSTKIEWLCGYRKGYLSMLLERYEPFAFLME